MSTSKPICSIATCQRIQDSTLLCTSACKWISGRCIPYPTKMLSSTSFHICKIHSRHESITPEWNYTMFTDCDIATAVKLSTKHRHHLIRIIEGNPTRNICITWYMGCWNKRINIKLFLSTIASNGYAEISDRYELCPTKAWVQIILVHVHPQDQMTTFTKNYTEQSKQTCCNDRTINVSIPKSNFSKVIPTWCTQTHVVQLCQTSPKKLGHRNL